MEQQKLLAELIADVENVLMAKKHTPGVFSQYHYIFCVFQAYSNSFHEPNFSEELLHQCLEDHYGIHDQQFLSRNQHYKKKVVRAYNLLCDQAAGRPISDRYLEPKSPLNTDAFNTVVADFCRYLEKADHSPKTIDSYRRYSARFLGHAEECGVTCVQDLSIETVNSFTQALSGKIKVTIKSTLGPVRIFLRFLYVQGHIQQDLSQFVGSVHVRSQAKIPSVWTKDEVLKLLAAIDRGNPSGKRDYAIILLVARLGIRVGEVNILKFENIDWRKNSIEFVQKKTRNRVCLPLLKDVGWAIIDYVQNGRPQIDSPYIFLTHVSPYKNFADDNHLYATIQKYLQLTDIQDQPRKKRGMHALRYSLANRLQENKETSHTISAALGHSSPDSASVYVKTDIERLRECALEPSEVGI